MENINPLEVFNLMMNGDLKEGLKLAANQLEMDEESLNQLIKIYSENPNMNSEQLISAYNLLKK